FAELDKHIALVPSLRHELERVAITRLQILGRVQPQPERHGATPSVSGIAEVLLAAEEHHRARLFRKTQRIAVAAFPFGNHDYAALGQTSLRLQTVSGGRVVEGLVACGE